MKQLYYLGTKTENFNNPLASGVWGIKKFYFLEEQNPELKVQVVIGRDNLVPYSFDIFANNVEYYETIPHSGVSFEATITIPSAILDEDYTLILVKKGVQFNERNKWTVTTRAKVTTASVLAEDLAKQINANTFGHGLTAEVEDSTLTISSADETSYIDYTIVTADCLSNIKADILPAEKPIGDKTWLMDLWLQCQAGKGFEYTNEEGASIYPNTFVKQVIEAMRVSDKYKVLTLRFANKRLGAKTRDEVVWQEVHLFGPGVNDFMTEINIPTLEE